MNSIAHLFEIGWHIILFIWNLYLYPKIREKDKDIVGIVTILIAVLLGFAPAMLAWFIMNIISLYLKDKGGGP